MNALITPIIINEVFPNPVTGKEWVEFFAIGKNPAVATDYVNFTISDDGRVIYTFQGDEIWSNNFLVIELSGLNNDQDSVIIKDDKNIIVDQMSYTSSKKGLSWLRTNQDESIFILGSASPNYENSILNLDQTPTPTHDPTATLNISPTSSPQPSVTPTPTNNNLALIIDNHSQSKNNLTSLQTAQLNNPENHNQALSQQDLVNKYFSNYQNYQNLQITYAKEQQFPQSRMVFLGQKILKNTIIDAIIGSFLIVIAAVLLSYEQKNNKN